MRASTVKNDNKINKCSNPWLKLQMPTIKTIFEQI